MGPTLYFGRMLEGGVFQDKFMRLYDLSENQYVTVAQMCTLGWGDARMGGSGAEGCWHERACKWGRAVFCCITFSYKSVENMKDWSLDPDK